VRRSEGSRAQSQGSRPVGSRTVPPSTAGSVPGRVIARETGFKEGQAIRVLPFGYVAHDEAADPASPLHIALTVGADDVVRQVAVGWGTWTYTLSYRDLGATPAPIAPADARSLRELRRIPARG
jgi:hypothetical protein